MATVVVTDGEQRAALAVVRALGRHGYRVVVCSERRRSLAGASRYASLSVQVPAPAAEPGAFASALEAVARRTGAGVVVPITDAALLATLPVRDRLHPAAVPWPSLAVVEAVADKSRVLEAAGQAGLAVPTQRVVRSPAEVGALADLRFPLVIKPSRSVVEVDGRRRQLRVSYAAGPDDLAARLASVPRGGFPVLCQERVVGPALGVFVLVWDDRLIAACAHRRLREKPPSGGVSVLRESVPLDPELLRQSLALLGRFAWRGVAMVEFKVDQASGVAYLMEVNGRFWGSLQLAIDAGVDYPGMLVALAQNQPVEPVTSYRTGIRSRWWWGDVDQLLLMLRRSREQLALPRDAPGRWSAIRDFLTPGGSRTRAEVWRWDDPWPFGRETLDWLQGR